MIATIAVLLVCALFLGEWVCIRRCRVVRTSLHQKISPKLKIKRALYRALLISSMLSLLFAFSLACWNQQKEEPRQGVAIVIDPMTSLSLTKSIATDLLDALPGISFSLYEVSNNGLTNLVPPTVDRLFLRVLLDGIQESENPPMVLSEISTRVERFQEGAPPWIVVVGGRQLEEEGALSSTSFVLVRPPSHHIVQNGKKISFKKLVGTIASRLQRSSQVHAGGTVSTLLITICVLAAWIGFVVWRGYQAPLFALFLLSTHLCGVSEYDANRSCAIAIQLAEQGEWKASTEKIEKLLSNLSASEARQRVLYTRALLSYLQGRNGEALEWLEMESVPKEEEQVEQLYGLSLIGLIKEGRARNEVEEYKKRLKKWLERDPKVSKKLKGAARMYASFPFVELHKETLEETLLWLEQNDVEDITELVSSSFFENMEDLIGKRYPKEIRRQFEKELSKIKMSPLFSRIWLLIALSMDPSKSIASLTEQALHYSGEAYAFSQREMALEYLYERINQMIPFLPKNDQSAAETIFYDDNGSAPLWYARSVLWSVVERGRAKESLCYAIAEQVDLPLDAVSKERLSSLAWELFDFQGYYPRENPLEGLLQKALVSWYQEERHGPLKLLKEHFEAKPDRWGIRTRQFIISVLSQDLSSNLASEIAQGLEKEIKSYSPEIVLLLWQLAVCPKENVEEQVEIAIELFETLEKEDDISFTMQIQPIFKEQLEKGSDHASSPEEYLSLLNEWSELCSSILKGISSKREVDTKMDEALALLYRLQDLFEGYPQEAHIQIEQTHADEGEKKGGVDIRKEDAVRLYQEMDRSDRALWE